MRETIQENGLQDKICHQIDMGLLQEVIPPSMIEELLETYQMWEERERKTNMVTIIYWLIALHLYPSLSQRRVYGKMVSGLRTIRDDVAEQIPARSALSYRRSQLGSEIQKAPLCPMCWTQSHCPDSKGLLERDALACHRWHCGVGSRHARQSRSLPLQ
jgi:hypothetical protein